MDGGLGGVGSSSGGTWGNIIRVGNVLDNCGFSCSSLFGRKVGNGLSTLFWKDRWLGDRLKEVVVSNRIFKSNGEWGWHEGWRCQLQGRALGEWGELQDLIRSVSSLSNQSDSCIWWLRDDRTFAVKYVKDLVDTTLFVPSTG